VSNDNFCKVKCKCGFSIDGLGFANQWHRSVKLLKTGIKPERMNQVST